MMPSWSQGQPEASEGPPETTAEPQKPTVAELIYRYRVEESDEGQDGDAPRAGDAPKGSGAAGFVTEVESWISSARETARRDAGPPPLHAEVAVALYQPVIGSETTEWELRIGFPSFAMLGRFLDEGQAELAKLYDLEVTGVTALDVANPVLRRVAAWPSAPTSTTPGTGTAG